MQKVKIMIVEDESIIAVDIQRILIGLGYEISAIAETGEEALKLACEDKPDLILMDIVLKGEMDGIEAASKISERCQIPLVYLTAHEDDNTLNRTKTTKPYGFILKPFEERDLNTTLKMALYKFEAEKKLAESEKRYFRLTENARDMIYRISLSDGRYEYINKAALEITGYCPEEFYNKPFLIKDIIHPEWRHYFDVQWSRLLEGDVPPVYEYQIIHKNGETRWINQRNVLIMNDKNFPIALEGITTDITEQKRSEQIIRKQHEEYRLIFDTVPAMIFYKDDNNKMLRVNKQAAKFKGSTVEEMEGKYTEDFYPDEAAKFLEDDREVITSGIPRLGIIERCETANGEKLWTKTDKIPYRNEKGQIVGVIAFVQDITQQTHMEEQLLKSERRSSVLVNTIPDILFQLNSEGTFIDCKVKNVDDLYFLPPDFINKKIDDVLPADFASLMKKCIAKAFDTNEIQTLESAITKNNRDKYFETRLVISGENEILAIMRDITERKRTYLYLRDSEEKYRKLTTNAPIAITRLSIKDLKYEFVNDEFIRQSGYTLKEFNALSIKQLADLIHPEDQNMLASTYKKWAAGGFDGITHITYRAFNKSGKQIWLDTYHYADLDPDGKPIAINQLYIDITEQKRYEEALRLSEAKFRAVTEVTPAAVYIFQNEKFLFANKYSETLTGYSIDELMKMNFWDLIHPDLKDVVKERGKARLRGENVPNRYEAKIITKSGEEKWIDLTVTSFELEGKPAVLGNALDITERKNAHEELLKSEDKFRKLAENAPIAVTRLLIKDSSYEFVNEEFIRQSGYTIEEFNSLSDTDLINMIHPSDRERIFAFYNKWRSEGYKGVQKIDYRIINRHKKIVWLDTYLYAEFDSSNSAYAIVQICIDISERKAAEEALKKSELKFRAVTEAIQASIAITKGEKLIYVNPYFEHSSGYSANEIQELNFIRFIHPDHKKAMQSRMEALMNGDQVSSIFECKVMSKSAEYRWAQISSVMIEYENECAVLNLILDITDIKRAQEFIKLSEEKFRAVSESIPAEIVILQDDKFVYANPYAEILTGYGADEIVGKNFWEFTHPDYKEMVKNRGRDRLKGKIEPDRYEMKIVTKDGKEKWVDYSAAKIIYNNKPAILGAAIDITERKLFEEALRESEARYRAIVEDQTEMIYRWNSDGTLTYVNDAYCRYFKKLKDELIGTKFYITIPREDYQKFEKHFKSLNYENPANTIEHRMIMPDKEVRWQRWTDRALFDENKNIIGYQSVGRDITDRMKIEEALREERGLFIGGPTVVFKWHAKEGWPVEYVSPNVKGEFGYEPEDFIKGEILYAQIIHPDDISRIAREVQEFSELRMSFEQEYRIKCKNGSYKWIHDFTNVIKNPEGQITYFQGYVMDITERKHAAEALRKSEERYRAFIQHSSEGIYRVELEKPIPTEEPVEEQIELMYKYGYVAECNETMAKMYGLQKSEEMVGKRLGEFLIKTDPHNIEYNAFFIQNGYKITDYESHEIDKNGYPVYFLNNAIGIVEDNMLLRVWGTQRNITELKKTEERIKQSLLEKEILLKEIHHRVKNNLQIITSLLKLQSTYVKDKQALELFKDSENRVQSMALIHQKLYQSKNLGKIDFGEYLRTLIAHVMQSFGIHSCSIEVEIEASEVFLSVDYAIPCGLIVNELVTNAYKHAFKNRKKGLIIIRIKLQEKKYVLEVKDNGIGIPDKIDIANSPTFGLKLISTLVDQIRGTMQITRIKGSSFKIIFE